MGESSTVLYCSDPFLFTSFYHVPLNVHPSCLPSIMNHLYLFLLIYSSLYNMNNQPLEKEERVDIITTASTVSCNCFQSLSTPSLPFLTFPLPFPYPFTSFQSPSRYCPCPTFHGSPSPSHPLLATPHLFLSSLKPLLNNMQF